jgi:hypothetical protein
MTEGSMSDLLSRRMLVHQLEKDEIARIEPVIFESLQKLCTSCESREECELGPADDFADVAWHAYCANAASLKAFAGMPWFRLQTSTSRTAESTINTPAKP